MSSEDYRRAKVQILQGSRHDISNALWIKLKMAYSKEMGLFRFTDISVRLCVSDKPR